MFICDLCGKATPDDNGAYDAVERYLAHPDGGICDCCWARLPKHVVRAAERYDRRQRASGEM